MNRRAGQNGKLQINLFEKRAQGNNLTPDNLSIDFWLSKCPSICKGVKKKMDELSIVNKHAKNANFIDF